MIALATVQWTCRWETKPNDPFPELNDCWVVRDAFGEIVFRSPQQDLAVGRARLIAQQRGKNVTIVCILKPRSQTTEERAHAHV